MTRELKLALIVGFSVMLLVTVLISDHLSRGRKAQSQAKLPEQPSVVLAPEAPRQAEPLVSITQGTLGGVREDTNSLLGSSVSPSITSELARRTGEVINGDSAMPAQLETTPLPLGMNPVPTLPQGELALPRPSMLAQGEATPSSNQFETQPSVPAYAREPLISPEPVRESKPMTEQSPSGASLTGGGSGGVVVRDAELRLPQAVPGMKVEPIKTAEKSADKTEDRWHTIAKGDSAFSIAKKYYGNGEYWKSLAKYNKDRIGANGAVRVGVRVRIPDAAVLGIKTAKADAAQVKTIERSLVKQPEKVAKETSKEAPKKADAKASAYTVKAGDSLAKISLAQLGTTKRMQEILRLNPSIKDADDIRAGMVLTLPSK